MVTSPARRLALLFFALLVSGLLAGCRATSERSPQHTPREQRTASAQKPVPRKWRHELAAKLAPAYRSWCRLSIPGKIVAGLVLYTIAAAISPAVFLGSGVIILLGFFGALATKNW